MSKRGVNTFGSGNLVYFLPKPQLGSGHMWGAYAERNKKLQNGGGRKKKVSLPKLNFLEKDDAKQNPRARSF